MEKIVLWGYGRRSQRIINYFDPNMIIAIIEENEKKRETESVFNLISYEEYKRSFREYDILITPRNSDDIVELLKRDKINGYMLLEDCPHEMQELSDFRFEDLPLPFVNESYIIVGVNLYAILLRLFFYNKYKILLAIYPSGMEENIEYWTKKYNYIINGDYRNIDEEKRILWACKFESDIESSRFMECFDFSDQIKSYHHPELSKFRNFKKGKACFIVGNGPSLKLEDLEKIKKFDSFGVNNIYKSFDSVSWRPTFFVSTDDVALKESYDLFSKLDISYKFFSDYGYAADSIDIEEGNTIYRIHNHVSGFSPYPKFSDDITVCVYESYTVLYICIQIAVCMGYKQIYLVGADNNYLGGKKTHFLDNYWESEIPHVWSEDKVNLGFMKARKYADEHGIEIYNATRGGKLEVFERVDFDTIFEE